MGVTSYFEFVTTLFSWIIYKGIFGILVDTGVVFIPIIGMVLANAFDSHKGGDDEGSAAMQSLKKNEADFISMLAVILFALTPMFDVKLNEMEYVKPALRCGATAEVIQGTNTGTNYDSTLDTMAGETGRIPLWWALMHSLSKAITSAAVATIPCSYDLASVEYKLAEANTNDPKLAQELSDFTRDCYNRARVRFNREDMTGRSQEEINSTAWLGSSYFLESGLYGRYRARQPNPLWSFNPTRDAGLEDSGAGGYPSCDEWWSNGTAGIRQQLLDSIAQALLKEMVYDSNNLIKVSGGDSLSKPQREDVFLRKYLAVRRASSDLAMNVPLSVGYGDGAKMLNSQQLASLEDANALDYVIGGLNAFGNASLEFVKGATTAVGGLIKAPAAIGEGHALRNGISMFQALALMIMVVALPFLLVFSRYKVSSLVTLSIIYFGFHFMTFIWAVAYWMDNQLVSLLASGGGLSAFASATSATQATVLWYMSRFLYLIFPVLYLASVGWIGMSVGASASEVTSFGGKSGAIGAAGGSVAASAATKGKV